MASFPLAGGRKTGRPLMQRALPYLLVAPTLIFITMFTLRPAVQALWDSAHSRPRANQPSEFVGVQNYEDLFNERHFIGRQYTKILRNTFLFTAGDARGQPAAGALAGDTAEPAHHGDGGSGAFACFIRRCCQ